MVPISKTILILSISLFSYTAIGQIPCLSDLEIKNSRYTAFGEIYSGSYACYYGNGKIESEGYIENGRLDSISKFYHRTGELAQITWYDNNELIKRRLFTYHTNGKLITTLDANNKEHGLCEKYFPNGNIKERKYFDHGIPIGIWTTWDNKGRIVLESDFTGDFTIRKIHDYKFGKHKILIQHFDKETNEQIYKKLIKESIGS